MKLKNIINLFTIFIVFVCTFVFGVTFVRAAPAPELLVINEQTQQCGVYWSGDEFSQYALPAGWVIYKPTQNLVLETPYGTCSNFDFRNQGACCDQLGLTNVGRISTSPKIDNNEARKPVSYGDDVGMSFEYYYSVKKYVIDILIISIIAVAFRLVVLKKYRNKKNLPQA